MYYTNDTLPSQFIWSNMTDCQKEYIQEKWYIYNYIDSSDKLQSECFRELSIQLGKSIIALKKIYYSIKIEAK